jgi:hypothetical protein
VVAARRKALDARFLGIGIDPLERRVRLRGDSFGGARRIIGGRLRGSCKRHRRTGESKGEIADHGHEYAALRGMLPAVNQPASLAGTARGEGLTRDGAAIQSLAQTATDFPHDHWRLTVIGRFPTRRCLRYAGWLLFAIVDPTASLVRMQGNGRSFWRALLVSVRWQRIGKMFLYQWCKPALGS